jgi:hypothetical protein
MLAGFGNMCVRDKPDSHRDKRPAAWHAPSVNRKNYHGPESPAIFEVLAS